MNRPGEPPEPGCPRPRCAPPAHAGPGAGDRAQPPGARGAAARGPRPRPCCPRAQGAAAPPGAAGGSGQPLSPPPSSRLPPSRRCRRHFPRFLLPLQSRGREGAAGAFLPPANFGGTRAPPGAAPRTCSRRAPGGGDFGAPRALAAARPQQEPGSARRPPLSRRSPAMPFHQRTVRAGPPGAAGATLFRSLEQVSARALVRLLAQLADLSRCAGDIFGELEGQAAALGRRTAALHRRLDALLAAAARLDPRRVQIREWLGRRAGVRGLLPPAPWRLGLGVGAPAGGGAETLGFRRGWAAGGVGAEGGRRAGSSTVRPLVRLSVWAAGRRPRGAVDGGGARAVGRGLG